MVFNLIATAIGGALGLGAFGVKVLGAGLALGAQYLVNRYTNRQKTRTYTAFSSDVQIGGNIPREIAFGLVATKGHEVRYFKWGPGNTFNASVIQLSDFRCDGLEPYVFMNGEKYDLVSKDIIGNEHAHYGIKGYENLTSIRFYDGRPDQLADQKLVDDTAKLGSTWKTTSRGANICYVIFERQYSSVWQFEPNITWVLRGVLCYDSRKDGTVSGGSGTHRIDDPSSWKFTKNPSVIRLNFLRGFKGLRSGRTIIGMGKSAAQIDMAGHIAGANVADVERVINSKTVKTYECNLIVNSQDDFSEILAEIDDAQAAYALNKGGLASMVPGAVQAETFDLTIDDLAADGEIVSKFRRNNDELFNSISGQYTNIEAQFQPTSLDTISVRSDVMRDNGIRHVQNDLLQVTDPDIAQYVLQIRYRQNRLGASRSIPVLEHVFLAVNVGDWGSFEGKTWMVTSKEAGRIDLAEVSAETYSSEGVLPGPVPSFPAKPRNPSLLSQIEEFHASHGLIESPAGSQRPALRVTWKPPDDPTITGLQITYLTVTDAPERFTYLVSDVEAGEALIDQNIVGGMLYDVSALIITNPDRFRQPTVVKRTVVPTRDQAVVAAELAASIRETVKHANEEIARLKQVIATGFEAQQGTDVSEHLSREVLSREVAGAKAQVLDERQARVQEDRALARSIQAVNVNVQTIVDGKLRELEATVADEREARVEGNEALARRLTAAMAEVDTEIADGLFSIEAVASNEAGVAVRIALRARVSTDAGTGFLDAGQFIEIYDADPPRREYRSRIILQADKTMVVGTDGSPIWRADERLGQIVNNLPLASSDGLRLIDLEAGLIQWRHGA